MSEWVKSSFSNGNGGNNCVEVFTAGVTGQRFVRNSKQTQVAVVFTEAEWKAFVAGVKAGEFDDARLGQHSTCVETTGMNEIANGRRSFVCGPECPPVA